MKVTDYLQVIIFCFRISDISFMPLILVLTKYQTISKHY